MVSGLERHKVNLTSEVNVGDFVKYRRVMINGNEIDFNCVQIFKK